MKTMNLKKLAILMILLGIVGFAFTPAPERITVKGSDTMVILAQKWAEVYMKSNPDAAIQVTGGGSGTGISALINGATDIAISSRKMKSSEMDKMKSLYNTKGVEIACAKDGITVFLHPSNKVKELTMKQLGQIFRGEITNWKAVGGADQKIKLYGRENSSGTYVFFQEHVLEGDYAASCQTLPGTAAVVNAVKKDPNAIGYGGAAYAEGIEICKVKKDENSPGVVASAETINSDTYPISRYLFMYIKSKPTGQMKKFIDWILSPEGQKLVVEMGYFPVK
ncbi:MAG: phosphate ABC transporter substrate-binding protein [Prolixibacteraceae bacterium]|jgi:phosphate transport system substrate-binding protein|nr:phosphate ABC transporter substrate-binding protein [Prolixibacteraceae bacterium]